MHVADGKNKWKSNIEVCYGMVENIVEKEKMLVTRIYPFPTMCFPNSLFDGLKSRNRDKGLKSKVKPKVNQHHKFSIHTKFDIY